MRMLVYANVSICECWYTKVDYNRRLYGSIRYARTMVCM